MDVLLDTHTFIPFVEGDAQLSNHAKSLILHPHLNKYISIASFFEIAIKMKIGKLPVFRNIGRCFSDAQREGFTILPMSEKYLSAYNQVPLMLDHRDPFDRIILATALAESLTILTADPKLGLYKNLVKVEW